MEKETEIRRGCGGISPSKRLRWKRGASVFSAVASLDGMIGSKQKRTDGAKLMVSE
ncbi:MAG: hypothetical protein P8M80_01310 [Pirellulaceae bacterium]|nr:hypothetical protein [Pirellulaceae bacterium]